METLPGTSVRTPGPVSNEMQTVKENGEQAEALPGGPSSAKADELESESTIEMQTVKENGEQAESLPGGPSSAKADELESESTIEAKPMPSLPEGSSNENGQDAASPSDPAEEQENVFFIDPVGTRWTFSYKACKTWESLKELIKIVFTENLLPDRYGKYLDNPDANIGRRFSIFTVKPEHSHILPRHWEELVEPGWEFRIEFHYTWNVFDEICAAKAKNKTKVARNDTDNNDGSGNDCEISKIVYVAKYLVPDRDGDWMFDSNKESEEKIAKNTSDLQIAKSILEEHREVCWDNTNPALKEGRIVRIGNPVLYIHSPVLLNALKAVISFQSPPDVLDVFNYMRTRALTTSFEHGRFVYPYTDLHHYRDKLLDYREGVKEAHDEEYSQTCGEHIDTLVEYLYDQPAIALKEAELMWRHETPKTTFASLWLLLKPGSDVYVNEDGKLNAYVVESCSGGIQWGSPDARPMPYCVYVWNLNFDGRVLTRSAKKVYIPVFDWEREISSLSVFPTRFHVGEDPQNPLRQQLVDRGKRFVEMVKKPTFQEYSGPSKLQGIRTFNRARVVVDHTGQPWKFKGLSSDEEDVYIPVTSINEVVSGRDTKIVLGQNTKTPKCPCKSCEDNNSHQHVMRRGTYDDYDGIDLNVRTTLTDHQYMLCWSHVYAFVLKDRAWDVLDVSHLEEPRIEKNVIDMLVMKPEGNKQMIKAICEIYGGSYGKTFSSDFIQGKGEGQILLLHGPPGTGKTLTAESVAEYTGRPLLSITAADLGHEPVTLEHNLLRFFRDAKKWNAIVLLDEADVYLETRASHDLRRNSIVSIFLRALDYFQGILFFTTNRIGSFDEAFMSRIHVHIGYDPLDEGSRKQIWDNHFKKLSRNHEINDQEIRCSYDAKEFVRKSKDLEELKWNGREIRNAFQTAVALACYQAKQEGDRMPELTDEHLRQVLNMSQNFKKYLKVVRGSEEEMASAAMLRNDEAQASGNA